MTTKVSLNTCIICGEESLVFKPKTRNPKRSYARCENCLFTIFIPRSINQALIKQIEKATLFESNNLLDMTIYKRVIKHPTGTLSVNSKCFCCKNNLIAKKCNSKSKNESAKGCLKCPYCKIIMFLHPGYFESKVFKAK